ncbi:Reverse transcriptase (RNA-dependent DNA polymerase) [Symmachiella dynata]|uniref:RNA-directed DNA polymerase n=1 Tax=Symmachiella dynata TaxID=2527995 RepID=A0A517ZSF9_9PLAN|nr:reverse transcriptase family protein [Symmachiella dynata]QDU45427.1 Reverse transcriptase (RNA-dependent DNA polymerase) [Symmachiella dynata]
MSFFDSILRWLGLKKTPPTGQDRANERRGKLRRRRGRLGHIYMVPLRRRQGPRATDPAEDAGEESAESPYRFARFGGYGEYRDLSKDSNPERLHQFGLPQLCTPSDIANWLEMPCGRLAWLIHRFDDGGRAAHVPQAHYHYSWLKKRGGGYRLVEAPKPILKAIQRKILREILDRIPLHNAAHGFVAGRSICTNAQPHVGQRVVLKFDLENFYANVSFSRVVAIFRSIGFSREAAIWLGRLTTALPPERLPAPGGDRSVVRPYLSRHLPQGAPTSPALANLSCYALDLRLAGMARAFGATYTRYADDLTFSGDQHLIDSLNVFIPLVTKIVRSERFTVHAGKRKVVRNNQQQRVTGVVVNERLNVSRKDYDRLKAILTNCVRHGAATQNREQRADFAAHLRGRIGHVQSIHPDRGRKLQAIFDRIDWRS